ncbi:hypothetical protein VQ042_23690 [Aurantimonas sp. A2-1-M11]|uniref:hypothetical protein n=1 Tax=Aurantimonas sp. A2-1-M11 TaxID=3113712 RepID=UPI002F95221F
MTAKKLIGMSALIMGFAAAPALAQGNDVAAWDFDRDSSVNSEEFIEGFGNIGAYNASDTDGDGNLTEDEFNTGVYGGYDRDNSGAIEEPEFGDVGDDMGDGGFWDI